LIQKSIWLRILLKFRNSAKMTTKILAISSRGQITIPSSLRKRLNANYVECCWSGDKLILKPVQTREEFFAELEKAEKDWETHGGKTLDEIQAKHAL
jgi:bifunctional DNA-binding transcriptional regulator/antitoxin component of YhaV-PrlF toxin-antitoxin module